MINNDLTLGGYPGIWTKYVIDSVSASGSGRIAFRYFVTDAGPLGTNSDCIGNNCVKVCVKRRGFFPRGLASVVGHTLKYETKTLSCLVYY